MTQHDPISADELNEIASVQPAADIVPMASSESAAAEPFADNATVTAAEAASLELSPAQQVAIVKLTSGHSRRDAAVAAGVDRRTLYRWLSDDIHFQAAYNAWQRDVTNTVQLQLLAASQDAVNTVVKSIRRGNARLAWELLKTQGMPAREKCGSTDAIELHRQQMLDRKKRAIAERRERTQVQLDDQMTAIE